MSMKFYITFFDQNNQKQTVNVWADSSAKQDVIETFKQDYGSNYLEIVEIIKA